MEKSEKKKGKRKEKQVLWNKHTSEGKNNNDNLVKT